MRGPAAIARVHPMLRGCAVRGFASLRTLGGMNDVRMPMTKLLFPLVSGVVTTKVVRVDGVLRIEAQATAAGAPCPDCGRWSMRKHGS